MNELTQERLKELLHYDPLTGIFTRRIDKYHPSLVGRKSGTVKASGYRIIKIDSKLYSAHRLSFLWMEGSFPDYEVDHINRRRDDNRWGNLRPCTRTENNNNSSQNLKDKGVRLRGNRWIVFAEKGKHLGSFLTNISACYRRHSYDMLYR